MRRKNRARALYISSYGNYKCCHLICCLPHKRLYKKIYRERSFQPPFIFPNQEILSLVDYKEKIVIYTKKSGDKNLTESLHRKISQTMRNFTWCGFAGEISHSVRNCPSLNPAVAHPLDFACYAKLLHVGFLPLVFFGSSLIGLETYCQAWQRAMKCSKTWILHVFELQLALSWIAQNSPSFFACFNDKKATKNTKTSQKLISNPF